MPTLNTATSIVDYLKSQGKPTDFNSRKALYESSGLSGAFGDYRGTAEQNTTLLRKISVPAQTKTQLAEPEIQNGPTTSITEPTPREVITDTTPQTSQNIYDLLFEQERKNVQPEISEATTALEATTTRGAEGLGRDVATLKRTAQEGVTSLEQKGTQAKERVAESAAGFGGAFSGSTKKSQAEIAQEVATKQQSIKTKLGDQLYGAFTDFERNYGTKFLESLSIPEAEQFTKLPAPVRGIVMQNYQEAITKAEEKAQKTALSTLEKLGFAVVGGQIVPSFEREKFEQEETRRKDEFAITEARRQEDAEARRQQQEVSNEFRRIGLQISASTAAALGQLRAINLAEKTAVSPGQIVNAKTGLPATLPQTELDKFATQQSFIEYFVPTLNSLVSRVSTGGARGRILQAAIDKPELQKSLTRDENDLIALIADMNSTLINARSGQAVTEPEFKRLEKFLPSVNLTPDQNKIRLDRFNETISDLFNRKLQLRGLTVSGGGTNQNQTKPSGDSNISDLDFKLQ